MSHTIIDRRPNAGGKNLGNRQRFLKRVKEQLKKSVSDGLLDRSITSNDDQSVSIPKDGEFDTQRDRYAHRHGIECGTGVPLDVPVHRYQVNGKDQATERKDIERNHNVRSADKDLKRIEQAKRRKNHEHSRVLQHQQ